MTLWLILGAMSAAVVAVLVAGLRRLGREPAERAEHDLAVYRAQLRELERDLERGVLDESELAAAKLEVQRRMLAADTAREAGERGAAKRSGMALAIALSLCVPAGAFALYLWLGAPGLESAPFAERQAVQSGEGEEGAGRLPDVETMLSNLRARLAENPDDLRGWINLGRATSILGRYSEAIEAYGRALALDDSLSDVHSALGEAQFAASGGVVTEAARRSFEEAVQRNPEDARARFYLAVAMEQDGDRQQAFEAMLALIESAPPDAPWVADVREHATGLAETLGLDPQTAVPQRAPEMSAEEQGEMIRGMVAGLAERLQEEPDDAEGWRMLGRSYIVLGEPDKAAEAYGRAAELLPEDMKAQLDYAAALIDAAPGDDPVPPGAVSRLEEILAREPANPDVLYYLGEAARRQGDAANAARYWQSLLAQLPPDSDEHAWLKDRIDGLQAAE